uniref:IPT/TIG domain-containing protein n=1 Tax=viral metagenome TaxID=1070528 RepID=A0A6C0C6Y7_9ZZZZ
MPISPNSSNTGGNSVIIITGVNLSGATAVYFGDSLATITANTPTMITVLNPPGNGVQQVVVQTNGGKSNPLNFFYIDTPITTSLSVDSGPVAGGNTISIYGYNLYTATSVNFGANSATPTVISDSEITVIVPANSGPGAIQIIVTTTGGSTAPLSYLYEDVPTISSITPTSGSTLGNTIITIFGTNLSNVTSVTFDGNSSSFGVINNSTVSVSSPAHAAGSIDLVLTTTAGSAILSNGYTYISEPGI